MINVLIEDLERLHLRLHVESELVGDQAGMGVELSRRLRYLAIELEDALEKAKELLYGPELST
jgi:hypothetical protein